MNALSTLCRNFSGIPRMAQRRKLILHVDMQNTITLLDSARGIGPREALNTHLATLVWGNVAQDGTWQPISCQPTQIPPHDNAVCYYKYLEKQMINNLRDSRHKFHQALNKFTDTKIGEQYKGIVQNALESLKVSNIEHAKVEKCLPDDKQDLTFTDKRGDVYKLIIPSFFKLINTLLDQGHDFAIVFRTMGEDSLSILAAMKAAIATKLIQKDLPLNMKPAYIMRNCDTGNVVVMPTSGSYDESLKSSGEVTQERILHDYFSSLQGIHGFMDDYGFWHSVSFATRGGKPFWVDITNENVHHIFLDDHIRPYEANSIVDMHVLDGQTSLSGTDTQRKYGEACLIKVSALDAINCDDYFIKKVEHCENVYSQLLADKAVENQRTDS